MERYEIEAFLTLAEELHFGRTAERLHVSTGRISQTIKRLERRVGVPLFLRTSRRVDLSTVGRRLYEDIKPAWGLIASGLERAVAAGRGVTGVLRVAFVEAAGGQLLVGASDLFRARNPGGEVAVREVPPADALSALRHGTVDAVLTCLPCREPDLVAGPVLVREARVLAVASGHPFAERESVPVGDLGPERVLRLPGTAPGPAGEQAPAGPPAAFGTSAGTLHEMLTLVGAGRGVLPVGAHLRRYHPRPDVAYVPLRDAPAVEWALVWRADGSTAGVRAFSRAADDLLHHPAGGAA